MRVVAARSGQHFDGTMREHVERGSHDLHGRAADVFGTERRLSAQVHRPRGSLRGRRGSHERLENFWSLLKRGLKGTYVSVEPFHLFRYLDEQAFRFNDRKDTDAERFSEAVRGIVGRRLTYEELIGAGSESLPM